MRSNRAESTTSGNAPAVSTADQARIAAALEASCAANSARAPTVSSGVRSAAAAGPPSDGLHDHAGMAGVGPIVPAYHVVTRRSGRVALVYRAHGATSRESVQRTVSAAPTIRCRHRRRFGRRSRACRVTYRQGPIEIPIGRCRASIMESTRRSLAGLRDAAPIQVMTDARVAGSAKLAALDVADMQRQADGRGTVKVTGSRTDQEGRGARALPRRAHHASACQRDYLSSRRHRQRRLTAVVPPGAQGWRHRQGAPRRPVNPGDHRQARRRCWHCRARVRALAPGRLRSIARSRRRRACGIAGSGRLAGRRTHDGAPLRFR